MDIREYVICLEIQHKSHMITMFDKAFSTYKFLMFVFFLETRSPKKILCAGLPFLCSFYIFFDIIQKQAKTGGMGILRKLLNISVFFVDTA
jgi:hypothetical protein